MASASVDPLGMSLEEIIEINKQQNRNDSEGEPSAKSGNGNWRQRRSRSRNRNDLRNHGQSASRGRSRSRVRSASRGRSRSRGRSLSRARSASRGRNQNVNGRGNSSRGNSTRGRGSFNGNRGNGPNGNRWRSTSRNRNASGNNQNFSRNRSRGNQNRGRSRSRGNQNRSRSRSRGNQNRSRSRSRGNQIQNRNRSASRGRENWVYEQSTSPQGNFQRRSSSRNRQNSSQGTIFISNSSPLWNRNGGNSYHSYKRGQYFVTKFARSRVQLAKRRLGGLSSRGRNRKNFSNRTGLQMSSILNNTFRSDYVLPRNLKQRRKQGSVQPTFTNTGGYEGLTVQIVNDTAANVNTQQRAGFRGNQRRSGVRKSSSRQKLAQRIGNRSSAEHVVEISPGGSVLTTVRQQNGGGPFRQRMRRSVSSGSEDFASQRNFHSKLNPRIQQAIAEIQSRASANRTHFMDSDASTSTIATPTAKATGLRLSDRFSGL